MAETSQLYADSVRARELYKYYKPPPSNTVTSSQAESPDTILTSFAQLVAWRLGTQRAMVSLIDRETQYFVAESTKTLNLRDNQRFEDPADALWVGCAAVGKEGRLCEKTIALPPVNNGFPLFEVPDLREDNRFNKLPFVTGPPFLRFYAGTPLTTQRGVNIGSLFVVDDSVRAGLSSDQAEFLGHMGANIMHHLEMNREAEERKRAMMMTRGLATFVEGKSSLQTGDNDSKLSNIPPFPENVQERRFSKETSTDSANAIDSPTASPPLKRATSSNDRSSLNDDHSSPNESSLEKTFSRAAVLLHQSLQLDGDGGVIFFDTKHSLIGSRDRATEKGATSSSTSSGDDDSRLSRLQSGQRERHQMLGHTFQPFSDASTVKTAPMADILGFATTNEGHLELKQTPSPRIFKQLEEVVLMKLMKRYPSGKLWAFDDEGALSSEDEPRYSMNGTFPSLDTDTEAKNGTRRVIEANVLLRCFPGARSLIFIPLWDAGSARWFSGGFVWSTSPTQVFTQEAELTFCKAFGNSVMAEVSRLESIIADKQKGDFIGSISHELRSPLHGVLASTEFLSETSCDAYQQGLVNTIDSCGRTLLDTINHVLDFSKINSFKKNWRVNGNSSLRPRSSSGTRSNRNAAGSTSLLAETHVAMVIEQVIESVFAGRVYKDISTLESDFKPSVGDRKSPAQTANDEVTVYLDCAPGDWTFNTQPGALRRVVMNLFGNALKYTTKGFIEVKLASEPLDGETHSVHLTVIDSGKGISSEYLRTKLYTPFAQENSLAPGTGLGLSIVNTIVNMLQGEIKIDSKVGLGTVAHVTIPMQKASSAGDASESASGSDTSREHASNDIFDIIQQAAKGKTCSMRGFNTKDSQDYMFRDTADNRLLLLRKYFVDWFGFSVASSPSTDGEIVVVDENNVADLTTAGLDAPGKENGPILLIVCKSAARSVRTSEYQNAGGIVEVISEPIGPYKLAKALQICFQRYNAIRGGSSTSGGPPKTPLRQSNGSGFNDVLDGFGGLTIKDSLANSTQVAGNKPPNPPDNSANGNPDLSNTSESLDTTQMNGFKVPSRRASQVAETSQNLTQPPQILLVDDNLINLKLLETFMKKRKYQSVKSAMNGHEAVEAFKEAKRFDVIFMDMSMPIMSGFEATRAIRNIEQERRVEQQQQQQPPERPPSDPPALIIALTGLASSRDQSEAFQSGVDLFMTKPVTFRDVGKLLDDWEANVGPPDSDVQSI